MTRAEIFAGCAMCALNVHIADHEGRRGAVLFWGAMMLVGFVWWARLLFARRAAEEKEGGT